MKPAPTAAITEGAAPILAPEVKGDAVPELPPEVMSESSAKNAALITTQAKRITITTDLLEVEVNTAGGDIHKASLLNYPVALADPAQKVQLMNDTLPKLFISQSGLISRSVKLPDHHTVYIVDQDSFRLADGQDELKVNLRWQGENNIQVTKQLTFKRDSYVVDVDYLIDNGSGEPLSLAMYRQLQRGDYAIQGENSFIYTFTGAVISNDQTRYEKLQFDDMADWQPETDYNAGGYVAMIQHYFLSAWLANGGEDNRFFSKQLDNDRYVVGITTPPRTIEAGASDQLHTRLFIGPKDQDRMAAASENLNLTVDYGIFTIIADPLFWLLRFIHDMLGNWGWSILVLTLLIKLMFYPLTDKQYRSMAQLRKLQPKMEALKERCGDDRQKMGQQMMELYRKEKVNPLAGCLPILVQIPVFIALYWVLVESVELRQADFMFWINDLTAKDPYYVLPVLMGISMFIMQKLSPAPADPLQQKVMMSLPFVFTIFFAFFPAGLVLYWFANNLLSILQQWYITRKIERATS